jgi:hypothetical protein
MTNVNKITYRCGLKGVFQLTKGFNCPYHAAVQTLFLKTLKKAGFPLMKRVIITTILPVMLILIACVGVPLRRRIGNALCRVSGVDL